MLENTTILGGGGQGSINWKIPPRGEGEYQPLSFGEKNMKSGREKEGKCKRKRKKGKKKEEGKKKGEINAK